MDLDFKESDDAIIDKIAFGKQGDGGIEIETGLSYKAISIYSSNDVSSPSRHTMANAEFDKLAMRSRVYIRLHRDHNMLIADFKKQAKENDNMKFELVRLAKKAADYDELMEVAKKMVFNIAGEEEGKDEQIQ